MNWNRGSDDEEVGIGYKELKQGKSSHTCDLLAGWHSQDSYLSFTDFLAVSSFHLGSYVSNDYLVKCLFRILCIFSFWWFLLVSQSCLTLCDPVNYSPPGSSVHRISQARILEWIARSCQPRD